MVTAIAPANQADVEPLTTVSLTAGVVGGGAATYTWRVISGPTATIVGGTAATVTFTAPAVQAGGTMTIGVKATQVGVDSPEVTCTVAVLPHNEWWWTGAALVPATESWH